MVKLSKFFLCLSILLFSYCQIYFGFMIFNQGTGWGLLWHEFCFYFDGPFLDYAILLCLYWKLQTDMLWLWPYWTLKLKIPAGTCHHWQLEEPILANSAQAQAPAGLCWFYYQLVRPAGRPADRPADQNSTFWCQFDFPVKSKVVSLCK